MSAVLRNVVLYALLALMPLQCAAAAAQALLCDDSPRQAAGASHHDHDGSQHHESDDHGGSPVHDGCQQMPSAIVPSSLRFHAVKPPAFDPPGAASYVSYFPERLKRPPLFPAR